MKRQFFAQIEQYFTFFEPIYANGLMRLSSSSRNAARHLADFGLYSDAAGSERPMVRRDSPLSLVNILIKLVFFLL